jgi:hypothetical protein
LLKLVGAVGLLAALFLVDVLFAAGLVADFDATVSARPAAGLFWTGLHGFCSPNATRRSCNASANSNWTMNTTSGRR